MQFQFQKVGNIFRFGDVFIDTQPIHRPEKLIGLYFNLFVSKIKEIDWLGLT